VEGSKFRAQLLTQGGKILKGNSMSGIYLHERLLEYRRIFEQRAQTLFSEIQCGDGDFFSELRGKGGRFYHGC
jgi:hypothetical protein